MAKKGHNPNNISYWKYNLVQLKSPQKSQTQIFHTITCINPLHPDISTHIIHTVFHTFPWTQIRRISLIIKGCICWEFPLFSLPNVWFIGFIVRRWSSSIFRCHMAEGLIWILTIWVKHIWLIYCHSNGYQMITNNRLQSSLYFKVREVFQFFSMLQF